MPQRKSGLKELRKNRKHRLMNLDLKTDLKKTIKKFTALAASNSSEAKATLLLVYKKLDRAAKRNILHKNTVARRKSHFARMLQTKNAS